MEDGATLAKAAPSIGEMLDEPLLYWNWVNELSARVAALHAAQELDLLDHIGAEPTTAAQIAERSGFDEEAVRRLVEFLAAEGVFTVDDQGRFSATDRSRLLASIGYVAWGMGHTSTFASHLGAAIRGGRRKTATELAWGRPVFEGLADDPEAARKFGEIMGFQTSVTEPALFERHRFEPFELAVDVGGSHGALMLRLLAKHPSARGIVFDLPGTADHARVALAASGMGERIEVVGGSFFEKVPDGGDLYLMKAVLHDWSDHECVAILKTVRAAMKPRSRLAVIERIVPAEYRPDVAYSYDIQMMLMTSGRERRLADFEKLFIDADLALDRVTEVRGGFSAIEAVPA
jgi:hypothetical protein